MTIANAFVGFVTESPELHVVQPKNFVVKTRKVVKGAGAKLTPGDFRSMAKKNRPPQSWFNEDCTGLTH